jgi:hypothetical protein
MCISFSCYTGSLCSWACVYYYDWLRGTRTRRFITAFTRARQRSLSWARWIHSTSPSPAYLPKVHSNPILPSTPWSSKWSLSFGLSHQNSLHFSPLSHACHMLCPLHSPSFDLPNNIWWWVQIMKLSIVRLSPLSRYFTPPRSNILLSTLFSKTLSLCSSLMFITMMMRIMMMMVTRKYDSIPVFPCRNWLLGQY